MSSPSTAIIPFVTTPQYLAGLRGPWTIKTLRHKRGIVKGYALRHSGHTQRRIGAYVNPYENGRRHVAPALQQMIRECIFLNSINAQPRPQIQCAADAPNPAAYIAANAW